MVPTGFPRYTGYNQSPTQGSLIGRGTLGQGGGAWVVETYGPRPGRPGCKLQGGVITPDRLVHLQSRERCPDQPHLLTRHSKATWLH